MNMEDDATILRALDLLARLEESEDELVRDLRHDAGVCVRINEPGLSESLLEAAAALVALKDENFTLAAGQCIVDGGLLGDDHGHQYCAIKAERDRLKARWFADDDPKETEYADEFEAYRRDFPKDAP